MYCTKEAEEGFHTKGYIFKEDEIYRIIIGSLNLTLGALTKNKEWNTKVISTTQGEFANNIVGEFSELWDSEASKSYKDIIEPYTVNYELIKKQKAIAKQVDIPSIEQYKLKPNKMQIEFTTNNQVIMLRPTESPIVFIQQLGRGLRKAENKEYVVVLDFIGNYMNNFMIPIALSGDRTYNKDTIRRCVMEGSKVLPGSSTIHFDEISKKRIFESIDNSTTTKKFLKEKYEVLKNKLGKVPKYFGLL